MYTSIKEAAYISVLKFIGYASFVSGIETSEGRNVTLGWVFGAPRVYRGVKGRRGGGGLSVEIWVMSDSLASRGKSKSTKERGVGVAKRVGGGRGGGVTEM